MMLIGEIVTTVAQQMFSKAPNVTIDVTTRLAFSIDLTDDEFNNLISSLPDSVTDTWIALAASRDGDIINAEMKPKTSPPLSTHTAEIVGANLEAEKPLVVRRYWDGRTYDYDCYVGEELVLLWQNQKLRIGDIVLIEFLNNDPLSPIATLKIHKTW